MAPKLNLKLFVEDEAYAKTLEDARARITRFGETVAGLGKGFVSLLTTPIAAFAAPAQAASAAHRTASNAIRKATGATGATLDGLVTVYDQVRVESRAGVDDAAEVVSAFSQQLGLTGADLRAASAATIKLARTAGGDLAATAHGLVKTMAAWGVAGKDVAATMDKLRESARPGAGIAELSANLTQAAPVLRAAGLTLDQSAALLADFDRAGVPTDAALSGLTKAVTKLAKEGAADVRGALREQLARIRGVQDPTAASAAAVDLFGKSGILMLDAIKKNALTFDRLDRVMASGTVEPARLSRVLAELRIKIEQAIAPAGKAIERLLIPAVKAATEAMGTLVGLVGQITSAFGAMPEWLQKTVVVIAGLVAIVGPALIFAGAAIEWGAALVGKHLAVIIGTKFIPAALTALARGAVVGAVLGLSRVSSDLPKVAGAGVPAAIVAAGIALGGGIDAARAAVDGIAGSAGSSFSRAASVADQKLPPLPTLDLPTFGPLPQVQFDDSPIPVPGIVAPSMPEFDAPDISPPWNEAYSWAKQFAAKLGQVASTFGAIQMPSFTYHGTGGVGGSPLPQGTDKARLLAQISRLKGVTFSKRPEDLDRELARARSMLTAGDSMRLHAWDMEDTYAQLTQMMVYGVAPVMPGSWLDTNSPDAWMKRADEMDRSVDLQTRGISDAYWINANQQRDAGLITNYNQQQDSLKQFAQSFGRPTVVMTEDVFNAVQQGWEQATGAWSGGAVGGGGSPSSSAAPPPPPAAARPAASRPVQFAQSVSGAASAQGGASAGGRAPAPAAGGGGALTEPQLWARHKADGFWPIVRSGGDAVAMRRSGDWRFFDPEYSTPPRELFYRGESEGYPVFAYADGQEYPGSSVDEVAVIRADRRAPAGGGAPTPGRAPAPAAGGGASAGGRSNGPGRTTGIDTRGRIGPIEPVVKRPGGAA